MSRRPWDVIGNSGPGKLFGNDAANRLVGLGGDGGPDRCRVSELDGDLTAGCEVTDTL